MLAGWKKSPKGEVKIGDRIVNDVPPKDRDIAMVFQSYALYPHMLCTIIWQLASSCARHQGRYQRRVQEAAEILGIQDMLTRKPRQLSGGQRQRVALGRANCSRTEGFPLDEPLSNWMPNLRIAMRSEITNFINVCKRHSST